MNSAIALPDGRASFWRRCGAFLRWLVSIPSFFVLFLGYLWMLWDGEKQSWHDKAAGSVVIHADDL